VYLQLKNNDNSSLGMLGQKLQTCGYVQQGQIFAVTISTENGRQCD